MFFQSRSESKMGFYPRTGLQPKYGQIVFWSMSVHTELNSSCITLVAFLIGSKFLLEKTVLGIDYWLIPNRQYFVLINLY